MIKLAYTFLLVKYHGKCTGPYGMHFVHSLHPWVYFTALNNLHHHLFHFLFCILSVSLS